jgi:hypothetical protein
MSEYTDASSTGTHVPIQSGETSMTTRSIASILASLKKADTQAQTDINDLAAKFKGKARDTIRTALLPDVAKLYKVKLIAGAGKATGTMVLDSEADNYEAARKFLGRIINTIAPNEAKPTSQARIAPAARKAAKAYLAQFDTLADAIAALKAVA